MPKLKAPLITGIVVLICPLLAAAQIAPMIELPILPQGPIPGIEVIVNAKGSLIFAIDTASQAMALVNSLYAERMGLQSLGEVREGDPSGSNPITLKTIWFESATFRSALFRDLSVFSLDINKIPKLQGIDGIFGSSLFSEYQLSLDYPSRRVRFERDQLQGPTEPTRPDKVIIRGPVDLPLDMTNHVPVIEAKINGKGPYRFALDTGFGGMVEVTAALAEQLAMPAIGEMKAGDPSGRNPRTVRLFRAESVDVGSAHFGGVSVSESSRGNPGDTDGVIGLSLFQGLLVRFDYVNGRFVVRSGSLSAEASLAYSNERGVPSIGIDVYGVKAKVDIDSGSPAELSLPLSMAKSLPLAAKPQVVGRGRTADGDFDVYGATLNGQVRVGGIVLTNPRLDFVSVFPNGNLGYRFLKNLIVTFDPTNRRVRFEKPS
jgi:predicted aspartyl protease